MPYQGHYATKPRRGESSKEASKEKDVRVSPFGHFIDNHIRLIAAVGTILVLLLLWFAVERIMTAIGNHISPEIEGERVTVNFLYALDNKTEPITWQDFDGFGYTVRSDYEGESGRFQMREYRVDGGEWILLVGGNPDNQKSLEYIRLYSSSDASATYNFGKDTGLYAFIEKYGSPDKEQTK